MKYIVKTIIVASSSTTDEGSAISRGVVGGLLFGDIGMLAGVLTGKKKEETTFQIIYDDGSQKTEKVETNSYIFKEYCKYLNN